MSKLFDIFTKSYTLSPEKDPDFFSYIGDLYCTEEVQSMRAYPQHSDVNRLDHIRAVTYMSYILSKKFSLDIKAASRAALLHDLVYYDWHDADFSHRPHGFRHPAFAVFNARLLNPDITKKEERIILRHMWPLTPLPPSSKEGFIVTFSDKYCASMEMRITKKEKYRKKFEDRLSELNSSMNK
ncbi:MAG: hydrolase [Clostridia bacterium]|nr:hydrolase [Clostridia bacterium]